jgi:hypothetical protein
MTTTLTYLAAQQHLNDRRRDAQHARRHGQRRPRRPTRPATPRLLARLVHRTATT